MPATYADAVAVAVAVAVAEVKFWRSRNDDMELAVTADGSRFQGDYMLERMRWRS